MKIYLICPVRYCTEDELQFIVDYVECMENRGHQVFFPHRDAPQSDKIAIDIVRSEVQAISDADRVDIYWNASSKGSHFDFGVTFAYKKKIQLINKPKDEDRKSYLKVIKQVIEEGYKR